MLSARATMWSVLSEGYLNSITGELSERGELDGGNDGGAGPMR